MVRPVSSMPYWQGLIVTVLSVSQLATFGFAQDAASSTPVVTSSPSITSANTPSSTSSAPPQIHTIQVGLADHKMKPEVTVANVGDIVEFRFYPLNHSVVRAEFEYPCIPYEMTGSSKKGFHSGFFPVDKVLPNPPMYSIDINDTLPIFFYCSAPGSCITYGMVGVINPPANNSIDRQRQLALDSSYMLQPGEPFPAESPLPSNLPPSIPSSLPTTTSNQGEKASKHGLAAGAIAGIVVGSVALLLLGALLFYFWGRNKALKDEVDRTQSTIHRRMSPVPTAGFPIHHHHQQQMQSSQSAPLNAQNPSSTVYQHYTPQKYTNASVAQTPTPPPPPSSLAHPSYPHMHTHSPSPPPGMHFIPPPPHHLQHTPTHTRDQSLEISPMMGYHDTHSHNASHSRTPTLESGAPWSAAPTYVHYGEGVVPAPAYEENAHAAALAQEPVEMDGEGRAVGGRERGGEEAGKRDSFGRG
ncbi:hypothetical protein P153DRAFT_400574 [Dothidotthia symphoricarpi CBS 119687]|uniref:Cupredoxin n=1 Tax=Dothidotthia symphoricarpi CBS 119687 TaxID=1392245 RepID=A0A6A5ZZV2_9PLEO|nr:uncharacterized protein P153DRAFT_400574 [Dothidotthia symphoricarpi CBS 119687]KAF2125080.1 hypothetical protein P153DRAFT_400574 [Dothidotthia symphoricarpi CBS 119687]